MYVDFGQARKIAQQSVQLLQSEFEQGVLNGSIVSNYRQPESAFPHGSKMRAWGLRGELLVWAWIESPAAALNPADEGKKE